MLLSSTANRFEHTNTGGSVCKSEGFPVTQLPQPRLRMELQQQIHTNRNGQEWHIRFPRQGKRSEGQ